MCCWTALRRRWIPGSQRLGASSWFNKAYCYSIVTMAHREDNGALWELVAAWSRSASAFPLEKQILKRCYSRHFPVHHEVILKPFLRWNRRYVVKTELMLKTAENRRTSGWDWALQQLLWLPLLHAKMRLLSGECSGLPYRRTEAIWKLYTEKAYRWIASSHFHYAFGCTLRTAMCFWKISWKHAPDYVEGLYQNWFSRSWPAAGQKQFLTTLPHWVMCPRSASKETSTLTMLSHLRGKTPAPSWSYPMLWDMKLLRSYAIPSPGQPREQRSSMLFKQFFPQSQGLVWRLFFRGENYLSMKTWMFSWRMSTRSTDERGKILCAANMNSVAVQYTDVLNMKRAERRELVSGKKSYLSITTRLTLWWQSPTEKKVFELAKTLCRSFSNILRMSSTICRVQTFSSPQITVFLYTYSPLTESDKLGRTRSAARYMKSDRRYSLTEPSAVGVLSRFNLTWDRGTPVKGYTPFDSTRIRFLVAVRTMSTGITCRSCCACF